MDAERRDEEQQPRASVDEEMHDDSSSTDDVRQMTGRAGIGETTRLLASETSKGFLVRWDAIQTKFVDEPHRSVKEADELVSEVMGNLTNEFSQARSDLESRWERDDDVSTEDLRTTLQRYRSFFQRLLAA